MRDLHDVSAALTAQPGMKAQTFVSAGFSAGAGASAGSTGYTEELAPTLKGTESGNCMPSVLCLNDNGRRMMDCQREKTGTLRAQEHGHQPLVLFENHGIDGRYTGPHPVSPTLPTQMGTGAATRRWLAPTGSPRQQLAGSRRTAEMGSVFQRRWDTLSPRRMNTVFVNREDNRRTARGLKPQNRKVPLTLS